MGFFSEIASTFGGGNAKKAAKMQVAALDRQTRANTRQAGLTAEAAANQIRNVTLNDAATSYAESLLNRPVETVDVRLAPDDVSRGDPRRRRQGVRDQYMSPRSSLFSEV